MQYRKFLAEQIFDGYSFLGAGQVLVTDQGGVIKDMVHKNDAGDDLEMIHGVLAPGFINCHCHLELSYLKAKIPPYTGLVDFLRSVVSLRKKQEDMDEIITALATAEAEMYENGISGIGDVANTDHALGQKTKSHMRFRTFIEVLNFFDETLTERLHYNHEILKKHVLYGLDSVLAPHAPYTVSAGALKAINEETAGKIITIHNQESAAENELFMHGRGDFLRLFAEAGFKENPFAVSGKSSLQTYLPYFNNGQTILLVHNTYIREEDIVFAKEYASSTDINIIYCLCPNANLYIEKKLPPVELLVKHHCTIVFGTDSYGSNWQLNIAAEIKAVQQQYKELPLETLLRCACSTAANSMGWNDLGQFKPGNKPGLVQLEAVKGQLTGKARRVL